MAKTITISTMRLNKSTIYTVLNVGLVIIFFFAVRYFLRLTLQPVDPSQRKRVLVQGVILFVAASVTILLRAYYRKDRFSVAEQSAKASEVGALGLLGADRLKKIALRIEVESEKYRMLEKSGTLHLPLEHFGIPVRNGDIVRICTDRDSLERCITTEIQEIDGYRQQVTLARQDPRVSKLP